MILDLPDTPSGIARVNFEIERVDFAAPEASGRQGGVQAGWPLWAARFEIDRSDPESADLWRAFISRMRGRIRRFYAGEPTRLFPLNYKGGFAGLTRPLGGAFDGSATGWAQAIDADSNAMLTLAELPVGFIIAAGDYIGFKWDAAGSPAATYDRRTLARAVAPAIADINGQAIVNVEPPLDTALVPLGAVAHFDNPMCVMQLVPEGTSIGPIGQAAALAGATLVAVQDLRP